MTERQIKLLQQIIEAYIESGEPIGSKFLIKKYKLNISSATVRNEMALLENEGYLEKSHTSSGRVPSQKGYQYFAKELSNKEDKNLEKKLADIFAKRRVSIDMTLDEAAKAITDVVGLTLVTTDSSNNELMKSIQLTPINDKMATVVMVTSKGRVESKLIEFSEYVKLNDVRIAVRLFKERLMDTPLTDLGKKAIALAPILEKAIKNYEELIKAFVGKVFNFHTKIKNRIYGNSNIIKSDVSRDDLSKLVDLIQTKSIWESIEGKLDEDEKIKIDIRKENISILSKRISIDDNQSKEISVIGSNRMDYGEAKQALKLLQRFFAEKDEKGKNER